MRITGGYEIDTRLSKPAFQLSGVLVNVEMSNQSIFLSAINIINLWVKKKLVLIPSAERSLGNFLSDVSEEYAGVVLSVLYDEQARKWAMKFVQPDSNVPARIWTTQAAFYEETGSIHADIVVMCTSPKSCASPVPLSTPGFIEPLDSIIGLFVPDKLLFEGQTITDQQGVDDLFKIVSDYSRKQPVIVFTQNKDGSDNAIDFHAFSKRCASVAKVFCLTSTATWIWSQKVGKLWSVFDGAIRTYYPEVDFEMGDMYQHPLVLKDRILTWLAEDNGKSRFEDWLCWTVRSKALEYQMSGKLVTYSDIQHMVYAERRKRLKNTTNDKDEMIELYENEVNSLSEAIVELKNRISEVEDARMQLELSNEERDKSNYALTIQNDELIRLLKERGNDIRADITFPQTYDGFAGWCDSHLAGKVFISGKAKGTIKKAVYRDVNLVYRAVYMLGHEYREMRLGLCERDIYIDKCQSLGIKDEGKPISEHRRGEEGDTYFFMYDGRTVAMEGHLRKGTAHDPKETLAIYFAWDEQSKRVLIGSLPAHLDTRVS